MLFFTAPVAILPSLRPLCLLVAFFTVAQNFLGAQTATEIPLLPYGPPVERAMKNGEVHTYRLPLEIGQYVHIVVEQRGVDVQLLLLAPGGKVLVEVDSPNGTQGPEPLSHVAEIAGEYKLEVKALSVAGPDARYEAKFLDWRTATDGDRKRVRAQRALDEAHELYSQRTAEGLSKALLKYEEALAVGGPPERIDALSGMAFLYRYRGENQKAIELFQEALALVRAAGNRHGEAGLLNNLATAYQDAGEYQKALDHYQQSLVFVRETGDRLMEANTLNNVGTIYSELGDKRTALDYYFQAQPMYKSLGRPRDEAVVLSNTGRAYAALGENRQAIEYHERALPLRRLTENKPGEAITLGNLGEAHLNLGDVARAVDYFNQSLASARAVLDRRQEALMLNALARASERTGRPDQASEYFAKSLELSRSIGNMHLEAANLYYLARNVAARGELAEARSRIEAALGIVESVRARVSNQTLRVSFRAATEDYYQFYTDLLMQLHRQDASAGHDAEALRASEQGRARALLELLTEARADIKQGIDPSLRQRESAILLEINRKAVAQTRIAPDKQRGPEALALLREIGGLTADYEALQTEIRRASPRYAALTQPRSLDAAQIRQLLDRETTLLEFSLGEQRSYLWAVTDDTLVSYELPPRAEVERHAKNFYQLLTARNQQSPGETLRDREERFRRADADAVSEAHALGQMLLGPVAPSLLKKRLLIVGDGALPYIPFGALSVRAGATPLIADYEIVTLPSASVLAVARRESAPPPKQIAILADPVFDSHDARVRNAAPNGSGGVAARAATKTKFVSGATMPAVAAQRAISRVGKEEGAPIPRLPFSRREAEAILAAAPADSQMKALDFQASRALATSDQLAQYRIVHFATHGLLDGEHPELSGIMLSLVDERGRPVDGFLRLGDIYNLKLPADLIVLSACQTALGKEVRGEGLIGLTRGFMYAGAERVMASLWKVDDAATAALMKEFYRDLFGAKMRPAAALRAAQTQLAKSRRWQSPYYWAAFNIQGEYR